MRIAIIAHNARDAGGLTGGINFVRCLKTVAPHHQFFLVAYPDVGFEDIELPPGSEKFFFPYSGNLVKRLKFDLFILSRLIKNQSVDVVFGLGNVGLTKPGCRQAIWIRDAHFVYPRKHFPGQYLHSRLIKAFHKYRLFRCRANTDLFFCQTPVMQKRFVDCFRVPSNKVKVLPNAVSEFAKTDQKHAEVPAVFRQNGFFNLLLVGKFYPHKNQELLIELFRRYADKLRDVRCIVTVATDQRLSAKKFLSDIRRYDLQKHIVNAGSLKQSELAGYYFNSDAMFFPTLLESFSTTYLEAMHFGLPILTSNLDFARYVCDDAALYFDPWDPSDIIDKILYMKNNSKLREKLIQKGRQRISSFFMSWEEVVTKAINELELLVK
jgi:glycosyltransferase involved in cell wall biosynthesis